jgi:hypothetical protein
LFGKENINTNNELPEFVELKSDSEDIEISQQYSRTTGGKPK